MKRQFIMAPFAVALCLVAGFGAAKAQSAADFYKGKSIRVIVGASAGGSYDTVARMMSRHMKRQVPGKPNMIVQNRPGASSRVAANWLYNAGPRDGTVIGSFSQTLAFAQVLGQRKVKYDARKFNWIGTPIQPVSIMFAWHNAGIKDLLEAQKKQFIVGATSSTGANFIYPALANYLFDTKFKIVIGYKGGTQVDLALERGEVAIRGSGTWSDIKGNRNHWITGKKIVPLVQNSLVKHQDLPNVPRFIDYAKRPDQRAVLELMGKVASIGRPMLTNRGVPADRVAALRAAFDATMKAPAFRAEAKKLTLDINPMRGADIQKLVADILATPQGVIDATNAALSRRKVATKCEKFTKAKYCRSKKKKKKKKKKSS